MGGIGEPPVALYERVDRKERSGLGRELLGPWHTNGGRAGARSSVEKFSVEECGEREVTSPRQPALGLQEVGERALQEHGAREELPGPAQIRMVASGRPLLPEIGGPI